MHTSMPARGPLAHLTSTGFLRALPWLTIAVLFLAPLGAGSSRAAAQGDLVTPPAPPEVAPVISGAYPNDADGDGIDDTLQDLGSTAGTLAAQAVSPDNAVRIELVFSEPVTQQQVDAFIDLGGQISYMYKAVSFGWKKPRPRCNG